MEELGSRETTQWYERDFTLEDAMGMIQGSMKSAVRNYVAVGFYLKAIRDRKLFEAAGYRNFEEFVRDKYDKDKGWASKCIKVNDRLSKGGNSPLLGDEYKDYNVSQLVELAAMTEEQRAQVTPDTSVREMKQIRNPKPEEPEKVVTLQLPEKTIDHFTDGERSIDNAYGATISKIVKAYLAKGLVQECMVTVWGDTYKVLRRSDVTVFYTDAGETLFDVENSRIEKEYQYWYGSKGVVDKEQEETSGFHQEEGDGRAAYVNDQYRLQKEYLYPFAKQVIKDNKDWFLKDYMDRVMRVDLSEPLLKALLGANNEGKQYDFTFDGKSVSLSLFADRIDVIYFDSNEVLHPEGTCEWFYFAAAVQAMWNEVTLEDAGERTVDEKLVEDGEKEENDEAGSVAISQQGSQEEDILPDEGYSVGSLPQAKESLLYQLAQVLVEKRGQMIRAKSFGYIPSDNVMTEEIKTLTHQAEGEVGLKDGAGAYASAEIIEFFRSGEDLGVCTYARFATQARKAFSEWEAREKLEEETVEEKPAVIDTEFSEVDDPQDKDMTDFEIARQELERENNLLTKCLKDLPDENDVHIRGMKLKVAALASLVCDLDDIENPPPKLEQPELPTLRNNDQRAAFVDAYETWPLWIETKETGERYYRYDLTDGTSMVVKVYHARLFDYGKTDLPWEERYTEGYGRHEYYLLKPDKFFRNCEANRSALIDKLKEIQKKG